MIARKHQTKASLSLGLGEVFQNWEPNEEEIELLKKHTRRKKITDSSIIGILEWLFINVYCSYFNRNELSNNAQVYEDWLIWATLAS